MSDHTRWAVAVIIFTFCVVGAAIFVEMSGFNAMAAYTLCCFVGGGAAQAAWSAARRARQSRKS